MVFLRAAWPDWIPAGVSGGHYKPQSITKYHHGPWHYIDGNYVVPGNEEKVKLPPEPSTMPTDQPTNAVQAIDHAIAVIVDPNSKDEDKAVSLAWLEHLVGDIHQPLHASSEVFLSISRWGQGQEAPGNSRRRPRDESACILGCFAGD